MDYKISWVGQFLFRVLLFFSLVVAEGASVRAQEVTSTGLKTCLEALEPKWDKKGTSEYMVWVSVCNEEIAELAEDRENSAPLDVVFVRDILAKARYLKVIPAYGVWIKSAKFEETLDLNSIEFPSNLAFLQSIFEKDIELRQVKMDRALILTGSRVMGSVRLEEAVFGKNVIFRGCPTKTDPCDGHSKSGNPAVAKAEFWGNINLSGSEIGQGISLGNAIVYGKLIMKNTEVDGNVWLSNKTEIRNDIIAPYAKIKGSLNLYNSSFTGNIIDLTGATIGNELTLQKKDSPAPIWGDKTILILRDARVVGALVDQKDAWPDNIDLGGFVYDRLSGEATSRDTSWFVNWLARHKNYISQPYTHLAQILRKSGLPAKASEILYAGKERERQQATGLNGVALNIQWVTIGHGYRIEYAFFWFGAMVIFGWLTFNWFTNQRDENPEISGFWYTLDALVPVISLDKRHDDIHIAGWQGVYFYTLKVMAYPLVFVLFSVFEKYIEEALE